MSTCRPVFKLSTNKQQAAAAGCSKYQVWIDRARSSARTTDTSRRARYVPLTASLPWNRVRNRATFEPCNFGWQASSLSIIASLLHSSPDEDSTASTLLHCLITRADNWSRFLITDHRHQLWAVWGKLWI